MKAEFGIERELEDKLRIIDYHNGNGDFHFHSQIEICLVEAGEIDALVNNHLRRLKKGELSVSLGYDTHLYTPVVDSRFTVLILPNDICRDFLPFADGRTIANPFITDKGPADLIISCFNAIRQNRNNALVAKGNAYIILGLIAENVAFKESSFCGDNDFISKILLYIHDNFSDDISLASVSKHFGYNPSYLSHLFKSCFNLGITRYINILRLKSAVTLLKDKKHGTSFCALESGFKSLRTFYRIFKSEFGCTPKEYISKINTTQSGT